MTEEVEMKKIVDDERLIYKVCCLYYQDDMNQKEIGDYLGISRSSGEETGDDVWTQGCCDRGRQCS